jgi:hypothetical protein
MNGDVSIHNPLAPFVMLQNLSALTKGVAGVMGSWTAVVKLPVVKYGKLGVAKGKDIEGSNTLGRKGMKILGLGSLVKEDVKEIKSEGSKEVDISEAEDSEKVPSLLTMLAIACKRKLVVVGWRDGEWTGSTVRRGCNNTADYQADFNHHNRSSHFLISLVL